MIRYLKGQVIEVELSGVVLEVNGIGYGISCSQFTLQELSGAGKEATLLIYHHITEGDQRLFGFTNTAEKTLFEQLITVKGVGPKVALNIISGMPVEQIMGAIIERQAGLLSKIPGIGKKSAERIILELREKVEATALDQGEKLDGSTRDTTGRSGEAIQALLSLGFKAKEAEKAVQDAVDQDEGGAADIAMLIKTALRLLKS
jgi:Holliday junction DNA helicase RuvA